MSRWPCPFFRIFSGPFYRLKVWYPGLVIRGAWWYHPRNESTKTPIKGQGNFELMMDFSGLERWWDMWCFLVPLEGGPTAAISHILPFYRTNPWIFFQQQKPETTKPNSGYFNPTPDTCAVCFAWDNDSEDSPKHFFEMTGRLKQIPNDPQSRWQFQSDICLWIYFWGVLWF